MPALLFDYSELAQPISSTFVRVVIKAQRKVDVEETCTFSTQQDVGPSEKLTINVYDTCHVKGSTLLAKKAASAPDPRSYVDREP